MSRCPLTEKRWRSRNRFRKQYWIVIGSLKRSFYCDYLPGHPSRPKMWCYAGGGGVFSVCACLSGGVWRQLAILKTNEWQQVPWFHCGLSPLLFHHWLCSHADFPFLAFCLQWVKFSIFHLPCGLGGGGADSNEVEGCVQRAPSLEEE